MEIRKSQKKERKKDDPRKKKIEWKGRKDEDER